MTAARTTTRPTPRPADARRGTLLMLGSALSFSTIAVFTRASTLPLPETLLVRGVAGAVAVAAVARLGTGRRLVDRAHVRPPALAVAALFTVGMTSLVVAYRLGSTVMVSVVYATVPLVVGLVQLALPGARRPPVVFWLAGAGVVAGVAVMTGRGVTAGDLAGMALALLMTVCVAGVVLVTRRHPETPMLPASALACLLSGLAAAPFLSGVAIPADQLVLNAAFGVVTLGLGRVFLLLGSRLVPSRRAALIDVLDAPLTPAWTLVLLGEVPAPGAVVGGGIVLLAVLVGVRHDRGEDP